jgi:O-antigen/teichoic acid export membrane protein
MIRLPGANVLWSGLEAVVSAGLSFASAFIIARLVGPVEVGVAAAAVAVHVMLWVAVNALFADALVQRATWDEITASSAFWAAIVAGAAATVVEAAAGWPLAAALGDHRLRDMSLLLALPLPLVGAGGAIQGRLTRARDYRTLAGRAVIGQGCGTLVGIAAALAGGGAWALVLQQAVTSAAGALSLLLRAKWRPPLVFAWQPVRELLRFGLPLTVSTLTQHGRYRVFALLIGGIAGAAALGEVHMAFRLVDTVRDLGSTALWRLMLPGMCERQRDLPALLGHVDRSLALSGLLLFPLSGALLVTIQPLVSLLLGPAWAPSGEAALPLVSLMAWVFLAFPAGVALVARGKPRYALIANLAGSAVTLLLVAVLRPATPQHAALVWLAGYLAVIPYILAMSGHTLRVAPWRPLRAGIPSLALAMLATAAAWLLPPLVGAPASPVAVIALRGLIGGAIYLPGAALLLRARQARPAAAV